MMLVTHEVKDYDAWKKGYDAHKSARDAAGLVDAFLGRDSAKPNLVHIGFRVPTLAAAQGFANDPGLKEAMMKAGVVGPPDIRFVQLG
ncbi:MAG: hypothetical protein ACXVEF_32920 [Polyangiales bacterium]